MHHNKVIAVDLDGVIFDFDFNLWLEKGIEYFGEPKDGVKKSLQCLMNSGYKIIVYTCRTNVIPPGFVLENNRSLFQLVENELNKHNIPYDWIWNENGKPFADYYIDDKAIKFTNWPQAIAQIIK